MLELSHFLDAYRIAGVRQQQETVWWYDTGSHMQVYNMLKVATEGRRSELISL